MTKLTPVFRRAQVDDAASMAELVNFAGEGMPLYLWTRMAAAGGSPWDIGRQRAQRDSGGFSYRNTIVCEADGRIAGCLIGYPLKSAPDPVDYAELPAMFRPLQELEDLAPGTWYVNVLAIYPEHRGKGLGSELLNIAEQQAASTGRRGMSIIVSDANVGAARLYERHGYSRRATRPIVKDDWQHAGKNWVLMVKELHDA